MVSCIDYHHMYISRKVGFGSTFLYHLNSLHLIGSCIFWLNSGFVALLSAVTNPEEEEARWPEEEALQDPQRPFGWSAGGLFRGCACQEVTSLPSPLPVQRGVMWKLLS